MDTEKNFIVEWQGSQSGNGKAIAILEITQNKDIEQPNWPCGAIVLTVSLEKAQEVASLLESLVAGIDILER